VKDVRRSVLAQPLVVFEASACTLASDLERNEITCYWRRFAQKKTWASELRRDIILSICIHPFANLLFRNWETEIQSQNSEVYGHIDHIMAELPDLTARCFLRPAKVSRSIGQFTQISCLAISVLTAPIRSRPR
jgi:hypothetical protein